MRGTNLTASQLQEQTQRNYEVAQRYYSQRRKNMLQVLEHKFKEADLQQESSVENMVIQHIEQIMSTYQNEIVKVVNEAYDNLYKNSNTIVYGTDLANTIQQEYSFTIFQNIADNMRNFNKPITRQNVASVLGTNFETFLYNNILGANSGFLNKTVKKVNGAVNEILRNFAQGIQHSGSTVSRTFGNSKAAPVRADILFGGEILQRNQVAYSNNIPLELQSVIEISKEKNDKVYTSRNIESKLAQFLSEDNNIFGLSMKLWSKSNNKAFSQNQGIATGLQNEFNSILTHPVKTWNTNHAGYYMMYYISKHLFNIIGPVDVAMLTGKTFTWMDDYIASRRFYFDLQFRIKQYYSSKERSTGSDDKEAHIEVPNGVFKIRELNKNNLFQFSNFKIKNEEDKYKISVRKVRMSQ